MKLERNSNIVDNKTHKAEQRTGECLCGKEARTAARNAAHTKINGGIRDYEVLCKRLSKTAVCEK